MADAVSLTVADYAVVLCMCAYPEPGHPLVSPPGEGAVADSNPSGVQTALAVKKFELQAWMCWVALELLKRGPGLPLNAQWELGKALPEVTAGTGVQSRLGRVAV